MSFLSAFLPSLTGLSTPTPESEPIVKRIQTQAELHRRYTKELYTSDEDAGEPIRRSWATAIYRLGLYEDGHHIPGPPDSIAGASWTQKTLANYLRAVLPPSMLEDTEIWDCCVSTLYTLILRLGNYPFQVHPIFEELTFDVWFNALTIIVHRQEDFDYHGQGFERGVRDRKEWFRLRQRLSWYRRLLFQSLAVRSTPCGCKFDKALPRGGLDDDDLDSVVKFVINHGFRYRSDDMKVRHTRADAPEVADFPGSCSTNVEGKIAYRDLHGLVRLMVVLSLTREGVRPQRVVRDGNALDRAVKRLMSAFQVSDTDSDEDITWEGFETAFGNEVPNLLRSLEHLFALAVRPLMLFASEQTPPLSMPLLQALATTPSTRTLPVPGSLLDTTALLQLSTFLPVNVGLTDPQLISITTAQQTPTHIHSALYSRPTPSLLLISSPLTDLNASVTIGVFLPGAPLCPEPNLFPGSQPLIFQLAPCHRVWRPEFTESRHHTFICSTLPSGSTSPNLVFAMQPRREAGEEALAQVRLVVEAGGKVVFAGDAQGERGEGKRKRGSDGGGAGNEGWRFEIQAPVVQVVKLRSLDVALYDMTWSKGWGRPVAPWSGRRIPREREVVR